MYKNILVPIDGGELSDAAVKRACSFAREAGAHLTFYHAKHVYYPAYIGGELVLADAAAEKAALSARDRQAEALLRAAAKVAADAGVACETLADESDSPYLGIVAAAEARGCDLIFMASHGRSGARALLLGSETQKVLTHCKIPVLVYR